VSFLYESALLTFCLRAHRLFGEGNAAGGTGIPPKRHSQGKPLLNWRHALQAGHCQEAQRRRTPEEKQRMVPACAPQPHTEPHALGHHPVLLQGKSSTNMQDCATILERDSRGSARRRVALAPPRAAAAGSPWSPARAAAHQHTLLCHPRRRYAYASKPGARQHLPKPQPWGFTCLRAQSQFQRLPGSLSCSRRASINSVQSA